MHDLIDNSELVVCLINYSLSKKYLAKGAAARRAKIKCTTLAAPAAILIISVFVGREISISIERGTFLIKHKNFHNRPMI